MQFSQCVKIANMQNKPAKASAVLPRQALVQPQTTAAHGVAKRAKPSRRMDKTTKFLLIVVTLWGHFTRTKAAGIPFFVLFPVRCNAFFGILLALAPASFLTHGTLNVTFALKPLQKVCFKLGLGWVCAGIFDIL